VKKHRGTQRGHGSKTGGHKGDIGILKGDVKGTYTKKGDAKGTFSDFLCTHGFARLCLAPHLWWGQKPLMLFSLL